VILSDRRQLRRGDLTHDELLHLAGDLHREGVDELPAARDGGVAFGERVG
jgi:hypothetical protein